jgi:F-type H+-transporting ATPase subunit epsilon
MAEPLNVDLVSPERILWSGEAEMVVARTAGGDIAFLSGHAPFLGALGIGPLAIHTPGGGEVVRVAVHGGFVEVSDNRVTILSDVAELAADIDVARAQRAEEAAQQRLRGEHDADAEAALRRAHVRLELAGAR